MRGWAVAVCAPPLPPPTNLTAGGLGAPFNRLSFLDFIQMSGPQVVEVELRLSTMVWRKLPASFGTEENDGGVAEIIEWKSRALGDRQPARDKSTQPGKMFTACVPARKREPRDVLIYDFDHLELEAG